MTMPRTHSLVVHRLAVLTLLEFVGRRQLATAGVKTGPPGLMRQSAARNRPPHSERFARSVSGHHAHHHQGPNRPIDI